MNDLFTDADWADVRASAIEMFDGELPRPDTEAAIIDVFEIAPKAVARAINELADSKAQGTGPRSCWATLKHRLTERSQPVRDVHVKGVDERGKRIAQAEQWLRAAGVHYDRPAEIEHELFGDCITTPHGYQLDEDVLTSERGLLRPWHDDLALRGQMLTTWRELRPRGEQLEHDTEERAERWKQTTGKMRAETSAARAHAQRTTTIERALGESLTTYAPEPVLTPADEPPLEPPEPALA